MKKYPEYNWPISIEEKIPSPCNMNEPQSTEEFLTAMQTDDWWQTLIKQVSDGDSSSPVYFVTRYSKIPNELNKIINQEEIKNQVINHMNSILKCNIPGFSLSFMQTFITLMQVISKEDKNEIFPDSKEIKPVKAVTCYVAE